MTDGRRFCEQLHYTTNYLFEYTLFKENYKLIEGDLSKEQALDADPKSIQQANLTGNLEQECSSSSKKSKKLFWIFNKEL